MRGGTTPRVRCVRRVQPEVRDAEGVVTVAADYSQLGWLLITAAVIGLVAPLVTVVIIQLSPLRSED